MTSNYWVSTQSNHWLVTRAQVAIARAEDAYYADSPEEFYALRIFFINCISLLAKRLFLRQRVTVTAIVFFHRFYSCAPGNSFCSTDPPLVIAACIYVASKVEETPIHIRNVAQESSRLWREMGYRDYQSDTTALAEMEFYLLEDLQFHLVVYHPFRSLVAIYTAAGKGAPVRPHFKQSAATSWNGLLGSSLAQVLGTTYNAPPSTGASPQPSAPVGAGELGSAPSPMDTDLAYGSPGAGLSGRKADETAAGMSGELQKVRQLDKQTQARVMQEMVDERNRMFLYAGDDDMPLPRIEELDEQVLQMAWFVLNDSYRTDLVLLHPPHVIAVAAIFLGLVLHEGTREKMLRSKRWMDESRERYNQALHSLDIERETSVGDEKTKSAPASSTPLARDTPSSAPSPTKLANVQASALSPAGPTTPAAIPIASPTNNLPTPPPQPSQQQTPKPALRGLASLPPRPSHLPPKPGGASGQSWQVQTAQQSPFNNGRAAGNGQASGNHTASPMPQNDAVGRGNNADATASKIRLPDASHSGAPVDPAVPSKGTATSLPHLPTPPPDALTFLAALNVDLDVVAEVVQEMLSLYDFWHRVGTRSGASVPETIDVMQAAGLSTNSPLSTGSNNQSGSHAFDTTVVSGDNDGSSTGTTAESVTSLSANKGLRKDGDTSKRDPTATTTTTVLPGHGAARTAAPTPGTPGTRGDDDAREPTSSIYIGNAPNMLARLDGMRQRRWKDLSEKTYLTPQQQRLLGRETLV